MSIVSYSPLSVFIQEPIKPVRQTLSFTIDEIVIPHNDKEFFYINSNFFKRIENMEKTIKELSDENKQLKKDISLLESQPIIGHGTILSFSEENNISYEEAQKTLLKLSIN